MARIEKALILGGTGLVGSAVSRKFLHEGTRDLTLVSLKDPEADKAVCKIQNENPSAKIYYETGNIFLPTPLKDKTFAELRENRQLLKQFRKFLEPESFSETADQSFFHQLVQLHRPQVIVDCINSATQLSYASIPGAENPLLLLIHFGHIFRQTMLDLPRDTADYYIKIGTTGTGGMGMNIPYTHGETQPSKALMLKNMIAGAQTGLLVTCSRTPGMPAIREIVPNCAIAWGDIGYGSIHTGSKKLLQDREKLTVDISDLSHDNFSDMPELRSEKYVEAPYISSGENGLFALEEFRAITSLRQMEFITPSEIADIVWLETQGIQTGYDIISGIEQCSLRPSYRAGVLREQAISACQKLGWEHCKDSISFELIGPPKFSKLLFEAHLLRTLYQDTSFLIRKAPFELSAELEKLLASDPKLTLSITTCGIPILMGDGKTLHRGSCIKVKPGERNDIQSASKDGWVDLRPENMSLWQSRIYMYLDQNHTNSFQPGDIVAFVFEDELGGYRFK